MMKRKSFLILILLLSAMSVQLKAQVDTLDFFDATGVHVELMGPSLVGINFNYYFGNRLSTNLALGANLDVHLGANFYLISRERSRHSVYISAQLCMIRQLSLPLYKDISARNKETGLYIPLGYEFIGKKGFTLQLECGANFVSQDFGQTNTKPVVFLMRIGKTFGFQ